MSGNKTSSGSGIGTALGVGVVVILLGISAVTASRDQETSDTNLPPDPFKDEEPRVVDCVGSWDSYRQGVTADIYCEVGSSENSEDETSLDLSPYIWSTTGNTGEVAIIDMHLSQEDSGLCELWVDGELFQTEPVVQVFDEEDEVPFYGCAIEVPIP